MTYQQTLDYLYSQLPMFHRIGAAAYKADLDNTLAICELLHHPENKFRAIHVAGTNGKGSTSHILAAILQEAGYKTGLYTSPHLKDFRERIRINGKMIPQEKVTAFVEKYREALHGIQPSFFEWTVGLAFDYFAREKVDVAVIETGLGGRLDSTNVIVPVLSVITNIGWDHMNLLGDSLEKIASEKAGIIKEKIPVVIGESRPEMEDIFIRKAKENFSEIIFADSQLAVKDVSSGDEFLTLDILQGDETLFHHLQIDLTGLYQQKNILTVIQSVLMLRKNGMNISDSQIISALRKVKTMTGLAGRWQKINDHPLTICDTGHNKDGIRYILKQLELTPHRKLHFVLGMVNDKDVTGILEMLPKEAVYYFCRAAIPRALDADELKKEAGKFSLEGKSYGSVKDALQHAQAQAEEEDLIFIGGSTFVVAEVV
ncbi:MAG: bifunctional folylpolyglutamate synthase/dihydrofolate synthase [Bacteroidetes bacterium]|nr:bifunctional folylpolyglutamate synthase/dihydrofolate synthase [Bacteroidota bacterium]